MRPCHMSLVIFDFLAMKGRKLDDAAETTTTPVSPHSISNMLGLSYGHINRINARWRIMISEDLELAVNWRSPYRQSRE